jgi:hypothetical protein
MNHRSQLPPERRRAPLNNPRECCQVTSAFPQAKPAKLLMGDPKNVCRTEISTIVAGQNCCSALISWAARQRRPTIDAKILVAPSPKEPANLINTK